MEKMRPCPRPSALRRAGRPSVLKEIFFRRNEENDVKDVVVPRKYSYLNDKYIEETVDPS
jgi:hypothetical protein